MFKLLLTILLGESGVISGGRTVYEGDPSPSAEPAPAEPAKPEVKPSAGDNPPAPVEPEPPKGTAGVSQEPPAGQGQEPPAPVTPKYGEFGDDPDKVYAEFQKLKGKTTATERNLAALNKTLESAGVKAVKSQDGGFQLVPINETPTQKRERRFNDQHKQYFEEPHIQGIEALIMDKFDELIEAREKQNFERQNAVNQWNTLKKEANNLMIELYPSLVPDFDKSGKPQNAAFNEAFYNRATEIWQEKYSNDPYGELKAAREAASELKVDFRQVVQAQKAGFEAGKASKTVIGPVKSNTSGATKDGRSLSKDEYLKLSPDEREKYDKQRKGIGS